MNRDRIERVLNEQGVEYLIVDEILASIDALYTRLDDLSTELVGVRQERDAAQRPYETQGHIVEARAAEERR